MRAVICRQFGPIEALELGQWPEPSPAKGQVLIQVHAASVNFPDGLMVRGLYQVKPPLPFVPGAEVAGTVLALGEGVKGWAVGDRVIALVGLGGFAEQCALPAASCLKLPTAMSFEQGAALVLTYGTSLHALRNRAQLQAGEKLVVLGAAGGVGIAAVEMGKAMGAEVIACASTADKLELCRSRGADHLINYSEGDLRPSLDAIAGSRGIDVVYDAVGGKYTEESVRSLGWRGRLLVVGFASGDIPKLPLNLALLKERQVLGVYWGEAVQRDPQGHRDNMQQLLSWFESGHIKPEVGASFSFDQAREAISHVANRQAKGKVVITM